MAFLRHLVIRPLLVLESGGYLLHLVIVSVINVGFLHLFSEWKVLAIFKDLPHCIHIHVDLHVASDLRALAWHELGGVGVVGGMVGGVVE